MNISLKPTQNKFKKELTNKLLTDYINELNTVGDGKILMEYLIMIGRSDNLAQNPKMTTESSQLLDTMNIMLQNLNKLNSNI